MGHKLHGTFPAFIWKSIHSPNYVSKWVEAITCPKNDANTIVGFIQRNIFNRYGAPRTIISEEGSHFTNKLFAKRLSRYGVRHAMGLAYHPQ